MPFVPGPTKLPGQDRDFLGSYFVDGPTVLPGQARDFLGADWNPVVAEALGFSLGKTLKKVGKAVTKGVKDVGNQTLRTVKPVARVAQKIAVPALIVAGTVAGASLIPGVGSAVKSVGTSVLRRKKKAPGGTASIVANATNTPPTTPAGDYVSDKPAVKVARVNRKTKKPATPILSRPGPASDSDIPGVYEDAKRVARKGASRADLAAAKARDIAVRLRQVADAAVGTPLQGNTARIADAAESVMDRAIQTGNLIRQGVAGADGAVAGAAAGVEAESTRQKLSEFVSSPAGLVTLGAGALALILFTGNRGGARSWK